jgi:transcription elongation factor GreA
MVCTPAASPRGRGGFDPDTRRRLEQELADLRDQRHDLSADLVDEQPTGDGGDQAQLLERADDVARIDDRIAELTDLLAGRDAVGSNMVDQGQQDVLPDGTRVTLRFADGTVEDLHVVLVTEEAAEQEQNSVLTVHSPLGRALAGRRVGDRVTYPTPEGETSAQVVALHPPGTHPRDT